MVFKIQDEKGHKIFLRDPKAKYVTKIFMTAFMDILSVYNEDHLRHLDLSDCNIKDEYLERLNVMLISQDKYFTSLEILYMNNNKIQDDWLTNLKESWELKINKKLDKNVVNKYMELN